MSSTIGINHTHLPNYTTQTSVTCVAFFLAVIGTQTPMIVRAKDNSIIVGQLRLYQFCFEKHHSVLLACKHDISQIPTCIGQDGILKVNEMYQKCCPIPTCMKSKSSSSVHACAPSPPAAASCDSESIYSILRFHFSQPLHRAKGLISYRPQRGRGRVTAILFRVPSKIQTRQWFATNYSNNCCLDYTICILRILLFLAQI